jgi:hypothetical protein
LTDNLLFVLTVIASLCKHQRRWHASVGSLLKTALMRDLKRDKKRSFTSIVARLVTDFVTADPYCVYGFCVNYGINFSVEYHIGVTKT